MMNSLDLEPLHFARVLELLDNYHNYEEALSTLVKKVLKDQSVSLDDRIFLLRDSRDLLKEAEFKDNIWDKTINFYPYMYKNENFLPRKIMDIFTFLLWCINNNLFDSEESIVRFLEYYCQRGINKLIF